MNKDFIFAGHIRQIGSVLEKTENIKIWNIFLKKANKN